MEKHMLSFIVRILKSQENKKLKSEKYNDDDRESVLID